MNARQLSVVQYDRRASGRVVTNLGWRTQPDILGKFATSPLAWLLSLPCAIEILSSTEINETDSTSVPRHAGIVLWDKVPQRVWVIRRLHTLLVQRRTNIVLYRMQFGTAPANQRETALIQTGTNLDCICR